MKVIFAIVAALLCAQLAFAIDTAPAFADPAQQARYERVIRELRCLVCRSETIADLFSEIDGFLADERSFDGLSRKDVDAHRG